MAKVIVDDGRLLEQLESLSYAYRDLSLLMSEASCQASSVTDILNQLNNRFGVLLTSLEDSARCRNVDRKGSFTLLRFERD